MVTISIERFPHSSPFTN